MTLQLASSFGADRKIQTAEISGLRFALDPMEKNVFVYISHMLWGNSMKLYIKFTNMTLNISMCIKMAAVAMETTVLHLYICF